METAGRFGSDKVTRKVPLLPICALCVLSTGIYGAPPPVAPVKQPAVVPKNPLTIDKIPWATPANPGKPAVVGHHGFITIDGTCDNGDLLHIHKEDAVSTAIGVTTVQYISPDITINTPVCTIVQWPNGDNSKLLVAGWCMYKDGGANYTLTVTSVYTKQTGNSSLQSQDRYTLTVTVAKQTVFAVTGGLSYSGGTYNHALMSK
jgi:hypothetical protein